MIITPTVDDTNSDTHNSETCIMSGTVLTMMMPVPGPILSADDNN